MIIFSKNFYNFWEKIGFFCEKMWLFCKKIWQFFQENPPTFTRKFNGFSRELRKFLYESLTVFTGIFDDFSRKLYDFCSKICWFLFPASPLVFYSNYSHPSKTRRILLQKSSNFHVKIARFFWRTCQIFLQTPSNFSTVTYRQIFL